MSRTSVVIRVAAREDAPRLAELWADLLRKVDRADQVADLELVVKAAAASPEQRFVVAEYDGQLAGATLLLLTTISPINLEPCMRSVAVRVFDQYRHHGVGRALMDAAATFAEESGVLHMNASVPSTSREAQRFMARLGLAPMATYRMAPVAVVRSRLNPSHAAGGRPRLLAARRQQRRARTIAALTAPSVDPVAPE